MDIARGSRRARHVAANASASGSGAQAQAQARAPQQVHTHHDRSDVSEEELQRRARRQRQTPETRRTPDHASGATGEASAAPSFHPFRLHRVAHASARLSMPEIADDSESEPDLSVLGMARGGTVDQQTHVNTYEDEVMSQEQDEADDTSIGEPSEGEQEEEEDEEDEEDEGVPLVDPATIGLKEISNLGKFTVSSHKQGSGVEELRSDDLKLYWQSDGPQPHKLTVYFVKRVGIRDIRFFVDYNEDESYTPAKIVFKSGISENNLIEFATMNMSNPVGWQQVPLAGAGGDPDGNTLVSYVLQMQILENHQNGKDTHLRGIKIYAFDVDAAQEAGPRSEDGTLDHVVHLSDRSALAGDVNDDNEKFASIARALAESKLNPGDGVFSTPDFMREPELR